VRRPLLASAAVAVLFHALVLFGIRLAPATPVRPPVPVVELDLVAPAPEAAAPPAPPPRQRSEATAPKTPKRVPRKAPPPPRSETQPAPEAAPQASSEPEASARPAPATSPGGGEAASEASNGASHEPERAVGLRTGVRYRSAPKPEYPSSARRLRQEGVVLLTVDVAADGRPASVSVKRSSGVPVLDEAAVGAVRGWRFEPARSSGRAVASRVEIPVRFSLSE
jgi:periplasmic protein TonB